MFFNGVREQAHSCEAVLTAELVEIHLQCNSVDPGGQTNSPHYYSALSFLLLYPFLLIQGFLSLLNRSSHQRLSKPIHVHP